jgi:hypothetical protein
LTAQLGGKKTGDSNYTYKNVGYGYGDQPFTGDPVVYQAALKFDLISPSHCLFTATRSPEDLRVNCSVYPIYLDQDIRTVGGLEYSNVFVGLLVGNIIIGLSNKVYV